jgi:hypothetical protein
LNAVAVPSMCDANKIQPNTQLAHYEARHNEHVLQRPLYSVRFAEIKAHVSAFVCDCCRRDITLTRARYTRAKTHQQHLILTRPLNTQKVNGPCVTAFARDERRGGVGVDVPTPLEASRHI